MAKGDGESGGDEKRKRDGVKREGARDRWQAGRKSEATRGVDSTSDDFERFVLPGSTESLANAAG